MLYVYCKEAKNVKILFLSESKRFVKWSIFRWTAYTSRGVRPDHVRGAGFFSLMRE